MNQTCRELLKRCSAYLEGELEGACCEEMEQHMRSCARCRNLLEEMKWTIELCKATPVEEVPPEVSQTIREALQRKRKSA